MRPGVHKCRMQQRGSGKTKHSCICTAARDRYMAGGQAKLENQSILHRGAQAQAAHSHANFKPLGMHCSMQHSCAVAWLHLPSPLSCFDARTYTKAAAQQAAAQKQMHAPAQCQPG